MQKNKNNPKQKPKAHAIKKPDAPGIPKWALPAVIIFTALLYARALSNGFVSLDDETYILKNPYLLDFSFNGIKAIFSNFYFSNYHPLTTLTYLFEYSLFGLKPLPYHLVNVLLHLLNTWLVFKLAEKLSGKKITALVVSVLFAVHPMHVESVAWIAERKDVLFTCFYLLSLLAYLRYTDKGFSAKQYLWAVLLFIASLMSKSAAITLPVLLVVIDIYRGRKINFKLLLEKIPFLFLSVLFGVLAIKSQEAAFVDFSYSFNFAERIVIIGCAIAQYFVMLVAPFNLSAIHYYPDNSGGALPWYYYASLLFLVCVAVVAVKQKKYRKEIIFALLFFFITISVMLQVVPVGIALTAERYTYIPYIGFFYLAGQIIADAGITKKKNLAITIFVIFALFFSIKTIVRIGVWKDGETLLTDVINKYPETFHGYWMRGNIRNTNGNLQGALDDYNKTMELNSIYNFGLIDRSAVRIKLNDIAGALDDLNRAVKLDSTVPKQYNNRAAVFEQMGNIKAAMQDYDRAVRLDPSLPEAYINRGMLKAKTGDTAGAMKDINMSIKLSPGSAESYSTRGNIKAMKGDYKGAIADFDYSLTIKPNDTVAYYNLGLLHLFIKDTAGCCHNLSKAKKLGGRKAAAAMAMYCR